MSEESMINRIAKLLKQAEDIEKRAGNGPVPPEAAAFRARATELADRYSIDLAIARRKNTQVPDKAISKEWYTGRPFRQQEALVYVIYSHYGCRLLHLGGGKENRGHVYAFGFPKDMELAGAMYDSILVQVNREQTREYRKYTENFKPWSCSVCGNPNCDAIPMDEGWYRCTRCGDEFASHSGAPASVPERRSTWYRSFWSEFVDIIGMRLTEQKRKTETVMRSSGTSDSAVVAIRSRDEELDAEFTKKFPDVRTGRASRRPSGSGGAAGRAAGMRADLGGGKLQSGSRKALS